LPFQNDSQCFHSIKGKGFALATLALDSIPELAALKTGQKEEKMEGVIKPESL